MGDPDKIKALYDQVSKDYDVGGYDDFATKMQDSAKRKAFYDFASKDYDLGDYSSFENNVKKKVGGIVSSVSSSPTTPTTSEPKPFVEGATQVAPEKIIKMPETSVDATVHEDDPIHNAVKGHREEYAKVFNEFNNSDINQRQATDATTNRPIVQRKSYAENVKSKINKTAQDFNNTYNLVTNQVLPNVDAAQSIIKRAADKNNGELPQNNETVNAALQKVNDFQEREKNIADSNGDLTTAAVNDAIRQNPELAKQIETIKKEHPEAKSYKDILPSSMVGRLVHNFSTDPDNQDVINHHPEWKDQFEQLNKNNLTDNPEYGANVVANELSRARQEAGKNNPVANAIIGSSKFMDDLAAKMYKNDPQKLAIYNDIVKKDFNKYIDTKDFVSGVGEGAKGVLKGIKNTAKELTGQGSDAEAQYNAFKEENEQVSSGAKGIYEYTDPAGRMAGMIGAMMGTGGILKGVGMGANLADKVNVGITFFGDEKSKYRLKFPGDPLKQNIGAALMTTAYMVAPNAVPAGKVSKLINGIRPEMDDITTQLANGTITKAAAKSKALYAFEQALNFGKTAGKQLVKGTGEMTAITAFSQGLDKTLGITDANAAKYHPEGELADVAKTMLIGNTIPSVLFGVAGIKSRPYTKESLYEMAAYPKRFESVLRDQQLTDPEAHGNIQTKLDHLDHLVRTKAELDAHTDLTTEQKKQYILQDYNEKILRDKAEGITNEFLKSKIDDQIKKAAAIKESIFKGKGSDVLPQEDHLNAKEYKEVSDIKNDDDLFNYFVGQKKEGYKTTLKAAEDMEDKKAGVKAGLDYMKDKAIENPVLFRQTWGNDIADKMFERATIQEIGDSYHNLIDHDSNDPAIPLLEKELDKREANGEVYKPKQSGEDLSKNGVSVIMPGEIKHPETITIKPKEKAEDITKQRDAEIDAAYKPDVKLDLVQSKDLVDSHDPIGNKAIHDEIKDKYKKLKQLIDCLWA